MERWIGLVIETDHRFKLKDGLVEKPCQAASCLPHGAGFQASCLQTDPTIPTHKPTHHYQK